MRSKDTNFLLNDADISFLSDESIFLKKQAVTRKLMEQFGMLEEEYKSVVPRYESLLPPKVLRKSGKISRGENYRGLPWIVLDCPATFGRDGVFAFRTLFWWGHPFSFTLHLSGHYLEQHVPALVRSMETLDQDMLVCINSSPWEHHHEPSNYIPLAKFRETITDPEAFFRERNFLKFSKMLPLEQHQELVSHGIKFLEQLAGCLR